MPKPLLPGRLKNRKPMSDQEGYVEHEGVRIYYKTLGRGTPLIMIHGNGSDHHAFDDLMPYFTPRYRVVLLDSRGHGQSDAGPQKLTTHLMAADVLTLMDKLPVAKAILFGFSDGANIALETAVRCPERVLAVIAISGNLHPKGIRLLPYLLIKLQYRFWSFLRSVGLPVENRAQRYGLMCFSPKLTEDELRKIKKPVLILAGTRDLVRTRHTRLMGDWIPESTMVLLKGAGHFSLFRETETYMKIIMNFLRTYCL